VVLNPSNPWSWTLENALEAIAGQESGVVVILSYNEGADELVGRISIDTDAQHRGQNIDVHNEPANLRMLGAGGQILADLGVVRLLALGRAKKAHGLSGFGLEIVGYVESPQQLKEWRNENE
jgi:3,4-dihydroxy 2-butanone 4-phosphate synthase/GTP cyclohydrolase II